MTEAAWVTILGALVVVLGFLFGLEGLPDTWVEIALADAIFVALASILVYRIEVHLDSKGNWTLFMERPALALTLAAVALGAIAGTLAELASSADDPPVKPALLIYEKQLQAEVFGPLREASADAFESRASLDDPDLYAKNARELSEAYLLASEVLDGIEPPRLGDQGLHSFLVARLRAVGKAYAQLRTAVAGSAKTATAEANVQKASENLWEAEIRLGQSGYSISLVPRRG